MRSMEKMRILAAAVAATVPAGLVLADISPATVTEPRTFVVSTSGATALGALTRGANTNSNNNPTGEQNGLWRLGVNGYQIGRSTYTFGASSPVQQYISFRDANNSISGENGVRDSDHIVYQYSEVGSINGVLNTVKSGGLFSPFIPTGANPGDLAAQRGPGVPSQSAPLWINGWKQINANQFQIDAAGTVSTTGDNVANSGIGWQPYAGQQQIVGGSGVGQTQNRIGYTDVRSFQVFAVDNVAGVASPSRKPTNLGGNENAQYGIGRKAFNPATGTVGTNFQALANRSEIVGETDNPNDSHIRNETIAIVPFAVAANPGTGLAKLEEADVTWLNGTGRLRNGANFNSVTREIGSGTRNQGANNLNIDPSWAGGERDRRFMGPAPISTFNDAFGNPQPIVDVNGNAVTVNPGDELPPNLDLKGITTNIAAAEQPKEHRVGPQMRFSDKNSGGSGVRPVVVNNRMAITPNLSVGDVGTRGIAGESAAGTDPMRVIGIQWDFQPGEFGANTDYTQPRAEDVLTGRYQQWSAAQAVSIIGQDLNADGFAEALGTVGGDTNPNKPIFNDEIDYAGSAGVHRNWLNNVTGSVATFGSAVTNVTPADAVIAAGFVPQQIMRNVKAFDGGIQSERVLSTVDPDGSGPALSEQALYNALLADVPGSLFRRLNYSDPTLINGNLGTNYTYKIFAEDVAPTVSTPTKAVVITARTALNGDLNNDGVRDLADATDLARAYVASEVLGSVAGTAAIDSTNVTFGSQTLSVADMIVLTDANGSGNVSGTNAAPEFRAVDRDDVIFYLKGTSVDTSSYVNADTGAVVSSPTAQQRREDGVRWGTLKKNTAIDTFNATVQSFVGSSLTQAQADTLKVQKGDVDGDGVVTRFDAAAVDSLVGLNPFALSLDETMRLYNFDPIYAELDDTALVTSVLATGGSAAGVSDFQIVRDEVGALLLDGDTNFSGTVDFDDLLSLAQNYDTTVDRWSLGDFDFNGLVNFDDLLSLAQNYGASALFDGITEIDSSIAASFDADWTRALAVVPEPTTLALAVGAIGLMGRRRRA
jgi:hypothetical protein